MGFRVQGSGFRVEPVHFLFYFLKGFTDKPCGPPGSACRVCRVWVLGFMTRVRGCAVWILGAFRCLEIRAGIFAHRRQEDQIRYFFLFQFFIVSEGLVEVFADHRHAHAVKFFLFSSIVLVNIF